MNLKIDLAQLRNIDFNDVGRWPIALKVTAVVLLCTAVLGAGLWFDTRSQLEDLDTARKKEQELKITYTGKAEQASNLNAYREQMEEMKRSFGAMLRQLPSKTEVAELLVDISQTGLQNGLEFDLFKPESEHPEEFYAELPIKIKVAGLYHEFGRFVSDVAALPRIVTLQDFSISRPADSKTKEQDLLEMEVTAKTYRYLEEGETVGEEDKSKKGGK